MRSFDQEEGIDARSVANLILDNFDAKSFDISNLKINKLIYFAHGFYSARFPEKLVRNHIEAWDNGPVIKVIFDSFKRNGREYIKNRATYFDYVENREIIASYDQLSDQQIRFILKVVAHYAQFTSGQLVSMTHEVGTPWHNAFHGKSDEVRMRNRIPDEWIRNFFVDNFGPRARN